MNISSYVDVGASASVIMRRAGKLMYWFLSYPWIPHASRSRSSLCSTVHFLISWFGHYYIDLCECRSVCIRNHTPHKHAYSLPFIVSMDLSRIDDRDRHWVRQYTALFPDSDHIISMHVDLGASASVTMLPLACLCIDIYRIHGSLMYWRSRSSLDSTALQLLSSSEHNVFEWVLMMKWIRKTCGEKPSWFSRTKGTCGSMTIVFSTTFDSKCVLSLLERSFNRKGVLLCPKKE
jgi:hypothetical protein